MFWSSSASVRPLAFACQWLRMAQSLFRSTAIACNCVVFLVAPIFVISLLSPALMVQSLAMGGAVLVWKVSRRGPIAFLPLSIAATLIAYGGTWWMYSDMEREHARLRSVYPFESMTDHVPAPKPRAIDATLPAATTERLSRLEGSLDLQSGHYRGFLLRELHEDAVGLFINNSGFGFRRTPGPRRVQSGRQEVDGAGTRSARRTVLGTMVSRRGLTSAR